MISEANRLDALQIARDKLHSVRHLLKYANAPQTLKRVRPLLRSLDGAIRNRERFTRKAERKEAS